MLSIFHSHSPFRIFIISGIVSIAALGLVWTYLGPQAMFVTLVLMLIEITFSFENAIINARVLVKMSKFWQRIFMTIGILVAVFGMRIVFPILVVALTAGLPWDKVVALALNEPEKYSHILEMAHPSISAFGGMFLLMLSLHFFFDITRKVHWIEQIERPMQQISRSWLHALVSGAILLIVAALPWNSHQSETLIAGLVGILTYSGINTISELFTARHEKREKAAGKSIQKAGMAGFAAFLYLEVLDASFSFDGVIGAFAITNDVILIAVGLGVGAVWVRSLTLFMVRRKILNAYRYLEHGAHYVIGILALVLIIGLFFDIPEVIAGGLGLVIIGSAIYSSIKAKKLYENGEATKS